jgi:hypothetical protein
MLLDLSASAYGKAAIQPVEMPTVEIPGPPPVPMPAYDMPGIRPVAMPAYDMSTVAATDLLDTPTQWDWRQLRDYVLRSIDERHGPHPSRDEAKITAVFKSFAARWGNQAGPIAVFAFDQMDGFWNSAPITVARFTKNSDQYFAGPISERLAHV